MSNTTAPAVRYRTERSTPKGVTPPKFVVIRIEGKKITRIPGTTTTDRAEAVLQAARLDADQGLTNFKAPEPVRRPVVTEFGPYLGLLRKRTAKGVRFDMVAGFGATWGNAGYAMSPVRAEIAA